MRISRITTAALVAAFAMTAVGTATPAQAEPKPGPSLLVAAVKVVHSGKPTWVKAYWGTTGAICDAQVTVQVKGATIGYPSNTNPYTSFSRADSLANGAYDYTAFEVTAVTDHTIARAMHLTISYRALGGYGCSGPTLTRTFYASLVVRKP